MPLSKDLLHCLSETTSQLAEDQSLARIADRSSWSRFHLHRLFEREVGETPKAYVERLRLERAAAMLGATDKTVLDIALESGFKSHEVFSRAFKRHFGQSPSSYRNSLSGEMTDNERAIHLELVSSVGPCTGLYQTKTGTHQRNTSMPLQSITRKEIEAQPILFIQRRIVHTELQTSMAECFGTLFGHAMQTGLAIAGRPTARYVDTGPGLWTVDFVLPLAKPAEAQDDMQDGFLYAGAVACAIHAGPYEELAETNAAVERWIEEHGFTINGSPWESYITSPAEEPDPKNWITEVYWPISG